MPMPARKLTSWSFSRYSDYNKCPFMAKRKHIDRVKEPPSDAMERGRLIGESAEKYIKGLTRNMPAELKTFDADFRAMRKQSSAKKGLPIFVENMWGFDKQWQECRWDDWNNCWLRIKLDVGHFLDPSTFLATDWKTGRMRPEAVAEYMEQLELYATGALIKFYNVPDLQVRVRLAYLDSGDVYPPAGEEVVYYPADLPRLKKTWVGRTKKMLNDTVFRPSPGNHCRWCSQSKAKGGPCKF